MFLRRFFSDFLGFLVKLSLVRRLILLGLTMAVLAGAAAWIWTQDASWGFVTLGLAVLAWALLGSSVAQISKPS